MIKNNKQNNALNAGDIFLLQRLVKEAIVDLDIVISECKESDRDIQKPLLVSRMNYSNLLDKLNDISW